MNETDKILRARESRRRWREANPEKNKACRDRWRKANPERTLAYFRKWKEANRETWRAANKRQRETHPDQRRARGTLCQAVYTGRVRKPSRCSLCRKAHRAQDIHGHHADYKRPLEVVWACRSCHGKLHRKAAASR